MANAVANILDLPAPAGKFAYGIVVDPADAPILSAAPAPAPAVSAIERRFRQNPVQPLVEQVFGPFTTRLPR